jgi:hypothetical protein
MNPVCGRYVAACLLGYFWGYHITRPYRDLPYWWTDAFGLALLAPRGTVDLARKIAPDMFVGKKTRLARLLEIPSKLAAKRLRILKALDDLDARDDEAGLSADERRQRTDFAASSMTCGSPERSLLDVIEGRLEEIVDHYYDVDDFDPGSDVLVLSGNEYQRASLQVCWMPMRVAARIWGPGALAPLAEHAIRIVGSHVVGDDMVDLPIAQVEARLAEPVAAE